MNVPGVRQQLCKYRLCTRRAILAHLTEHRLYHGVNSHCSIAQILVQFVVCDFTSSKRGKIDPNCLIMAVEAAVKPSLAIYLMSSGPLHANTEQVTHLA